MPYKVWEHGIVRDATPEEIEQMKNLPKPYEETNIPVPTPGKTDDLDDLPDLINDISGIMEI